MKTSMSAFLKVGVVVVGLLFLTTVASSLPQADEERSSLVASRWVPSSMTTTDGKALLYVEDERRILDGSVNDDPNSDRDLAEDGMDPDGDDGTDDGAEDDDGTNDGVEDDTDDGAEDDTDDGADGDDGTDAEDDTDDGADGDDDIDDGADLDDNLTEDDGTELDAKSSAAAAVSKEDEKGTNLKPLVVVVVLMAAVAIIFFVVRKRRAASHGNRARQAEIVAEKYGDRSLQLELPRVD